MEGAAQKLIPFEDDPTILVTPQRKSNRKRGLEPEELDVPENTQNTKREIRNLVSPGGRKGRINEAHSNWSFFSNSSVQNPTTFNFLPNNQSQAVDNATLEEDESVKKGDTSSVETDTYQLMNMKKLEESINCRLECKCRRNNHISSFAQFCVEQHGLPLEQMSNIVTAWQEKEILNNKQDKKVSIKDKKNFGIVSLSSVVCEECSKETPIEVDKTMFAGKNYKGQKTKKQNSSWYRNNVEIVLAALASGMGPTDAADFLSFLNIPRMQSFKKNTFAKIENLVGKSLEKIANQSMDEMLE